MSNLETAKFKVNDLENLLRRVRSVADYQFGNGVGAELFPENVQIICSKITGRIRYVSINGERLATLRPTDGMLSISLAAAERLATNDRNACCFVTVTEEAAKHVSAGSDVFAAHVLEADEEVRARDEVIVIDEEKRVLAVGRALLASSEMCAFKIGVAVKVRHGSKQRTE